MPVSVDSKALAVLGAIILLVITQITVSNFEWLHTGAAVVLETGSAGCLKLHPNVIKVNGTLCERRPDTPASPRIVHHVNRYFSKNQQPNSNLKSALSSASKSTVRGRMTVLLHVRSW
jgi:hypothetical protein